ncbi:hypothetical protein D3C75_1179800 [compost metagenome]
MGIVPDVGLGYPAFNPTGPVRPLMNLGLGPHLRLEPPAALPGKLHMDADQLRISIMHFIPIP